MRYSHSVLINAHRVYLTFDRTEPTYSVFRCTVKFKTVILCSCCNKEKMIIGETDAAPWGTSFRKIVTRAPACKLYLKMNSNVTIEESTDLNHSCFARCPPMHASFCPFKVLKLEYSCIVSREVFKRIPGTGSERSQTSISLKSHPSR